MKRIVEIGIDHEGKTQPIASLSAEIRAGFEAISAFGHRPGEARKALHSEIVVAGWGTEISALFSEHGTNAILPGGVYSLAPFRYYLEAGRVALESIQQATGVGKLFIRLTDKLRQSNGVPSVTTHNGEQLAGDERETIELPGFSSLPLPTPEEWRLFGVITAAGGKARDVAHSRDELRRLLLVCLLESGVPLKNFCRYRRYYRFGSFIFVDGKPTYFVALMRQSDSGLGLMPIKLKRPDLVSWLLTEVQRYFVPSPDRAIFGDFAFNARTLSEFVGRLAGTRGTSNAFGILDHSATFAGLLALGGFLTTALRDELLLPANYYNVGDLLDAMGIARANLRGVDGSCWRDPYAPTQTQRERALDLGGILDLLTENPKRKQGKGRPRQLPMNLRAITKHYKSWPDRTWAALVAYFWPQPSKSRIRKLLIQSGTCDDAIAWPKAIRIFEQIRYSGRLASARPLRLMPPARLMDFFERMEQVNLPATIKSSEKRHRALALIATISALGCRPQEALRICKHDFTSAAEFRLLRLHGTKVHRARREPPLHLFDAGPCGNELCNRWKDLVAACSSGITSDAHPLFAGQREAAGRYETVNDVLRTAFEDFTGTNFPDPENEGSFSAYSLRHAAAIRLVQAAIDNDFLHGNFQAALAESASALGHSYPVFLSCYIGTAAVLLAWPTIHFTQQ